MPLPKRNQDESKNDFIARCMGHEVMKQDFPDNIQRLAVCNTLAVKKSEFEKTFNDYPKKVTENAKRGIELNAKNGNKCATMVGKIRGQQYANGENVSIETIRRTYSYLSRAKTYFTGANENECGYISFMLWGGIEALKWAENKLKQLGEI
jgi:hypothetical protein